MFRNLRKKTKKFESEKKVKIIFFYLPQFWFWPKALFPNIFKSTNNFEKKITYPGGS